MLDRFDRRREDEELVSGALLVVGRLLRLDFRLEEAEWEVFSFVLVEPGMPSALSMATGALCSLRRVLEGAEETLGSGAAGRSGIFCRLWFRPEEPGFEAEDADLSFTVAFLLRPGVRSEVDSDGGSFAAAAGASLPAVVAWAAGWATLLAA